MDARYDSAAAFNSLIFGIPIFIVGVLYVVLYVMESRKNV